VWSRPSRPKKGPFQALRNIDLTIAPRRVRGAHRPLGLRQVHAAEPDRRPDHAHRRALLCANREIAGPGPERAVVFQNHSLLPWLTCFENVYLGVERVFGAANKSTGAPSETKAQLLRPAPMPRWPWWA
jgi:nitrate/nitrite transport system ATP-binding protein